MRIYKNKIFATVFLFLAFVISAPSAPSAHAALTLAATSITSDGVLTLSPATYVGIGTATPQATLEIFNSTGADNIRFSGHTNFNFNVVPTSDAATVFDFNFSSPLATQNGAFRFFRNTNTSGQALVQVLLGNGTSAVNSQIAGNTNSYLNLLTGSVGIGVNPPAAKLHTLATTEQLRLGYDGSNYNSFTVGSTGSLTIAGTGTSPTITLSSPVIASSALNKGTCVLGTSCAAITVSAGAICTATDTTAIAATRVVVSGTTLTITGNGTDTIAYTCL